ncbi:response regulator [Devosia oryziradicis]|uniref:Response regulator n=1 Tax=Devosia oryziradicis TaxID=2801335 RepID=A0ABX7BVC8_9HYPH|nr:response regulator [Devosia oryziradicis]QQR35902.1 response regulator [Devosia oryziradicis]
MIIPGRLRALVVDDNAYARAISANGLKKLGVGEIVEAEGGAAAILELLTAPFDLMLMDWYMPDVSGAGVMTVLRDPRIGAASQTPVILMTAYASRDNVARARELGVNEVLVKPFTTDQLGTALGRILGAGAQAMGDGSVFL